MIGTVLSVESRDRDPYRWDAGPACPLVVVETECGLEEIEWRRTGSAPEPGEKVSIEQSQTQRERETAL